VVFSNRKDDRFRSLQIDPDVSADLLQRYFAELGIVLRREDALLGVEQALLRLAHLDAGQIAQQVLAGAALEVAQKRETQGLNHTLGVHFTKVEPGLVEAEMPITPALLQPFGFLHGGATIALLESVASAGGELACELKMKEEAGVSSRCIPLEQEHLGDTCACCGKPAKHMVYWGVAY